MAKIKDKMLDDLEFQRKEFARDIEEKEKDYFLNQCSGANKINDISTKYGHYTEHRVGDKIVKLTFNTYQNGEDDYDDELVDIEIS